MKCQSLLLRVFLLRVYSKIANVINEYAISEPEIRRHMIWLFLYVY